MRENKHLLGATLKSETTTKKLNRKILNLKKKDDANHANDASSSKHDVLATVNELLASTKYVSDTERMQNVCTKALDTFEKSGHAFDMLDAFDVEEISRTLNQ